MFETVDLSMIARVRRWLHFPGIEPERELIGQPERSLRRFSIYSSFCRPEAGSPPRAFLYLSRCFSHPLFRH